SSTDRPPCGWSGYGLRDGFIIAENPAPVKGPGAIMSHPPRPGAAVTPWEAQYGALILRDGIAAIPSALFHHQGALDLAAQEVWFVSYILAHKWDAALPYPSLKKMATQSGVDRKWLKELRARLVAKELLRVEERFDAQ